MGDILVEGQEGDVFGIGARFTAEPMGLTESPAAGNLVGLESFGGGETEGPSVTQASPPTVEIGPGYSFTIRAPDGRVMGFFGYPRTVGEPDPWSGGFRPGPRPNAPPQPPPTEEDISSVPGQTGMLNVANINQTNVNVIEGPPSSPGPGPTSAPSSTPGGDTVDA